MISIVMIQFNKYIGLVAIVCLIFVLFKIKKASPKKEYKDKTIKQYKRWHK